MGYGRHVVFRYQPQPRKRQFHRVARPNGSGKSTLLKTVLGILAPLSGNSRSAVAPHRCSIHACNGNRSTQSTCFQLRGLMGVCGRVGQAGHQPEQSAILPADAWRIRAPPISHPSFSPNFPAVKSSACSWRARWRLSGFSAARRPTAGITTDAQARHGSAACHSRKQQLTILLVADLMTVRRYAREVVWLHGGRVLHGSVGDLLSQDKIVEPLSLKLDDMNLVREIFSPDFLFRNSVYISLLVGLVCPLLGVYLILRRLIFMGVALPQFFLRNRFRLCPASLGPDSHSTRSSTAWPSLARLSSRCRPSSSYPFWHAVEVDRSKAGSARSTSWRERGASCSWPRIR